MRADSGSRMEGRELFAFLQNVSFCREYWRKRGFLVHINISLLEHVSPIEWENVILYGQYVLNPDDIR